MTGKLVSWGILENADWIAAMDISLSTPLEATRQRGLEVVLVRCPPSRRQLASGMAREGEGAGEQ